MSISFSIVDGPEFGATASFILEEAWTPPVPSYSPEYLKWQMSFPSAAPGHAVAAFDGPEPVGFAGTTGRRLRNASVTIDVVVVSFVAVRPGWHRRGIASGLYETLLQRLFEVGATVVTYATPSSAGDNAILKVYPLAGFDVVSLGTYNGYGFAQRRRPAETDWRACFSEDRDSIERLAVNPSVLGKSVLYNSPTPLQMDHYFKDPRPRRLIVAEHKRLGTQGAAFALCAELRTAQGTVHTATLDCAWLSSVDADGVRAVLDLASTAWPDTMPSGQVVMCPNLCTVEEDSLKAAGLRRTGAQFIGYICAPRGRQLPRFDTTNLEIV
ncbi:MAG: hypothetical protein C5B58_14630 [Acidobacteria bacterium]|nr:MAG: hypothetical protein C5B58_14630 [Acidobacteriota bacterium]